MSFNIALSGLQSTTQDLNTISNNIANSTTVGFRGGRSEFSAIYNGGQAGGVSVMSTTQNFTKGGSLTYTGRQLDMGIQGDGFFVLKGTDGANMYARAGMFHQDSQGYVVDPIGNRLQGYGASATGRIQTGNAIDLQIQTASLAAKATTDVALVSNLDARVAIIDPAVTAFDATKSDTFHSSNTVSVYDSLGTEHAMTQYYVKTGSNSWNVHFMMDGNDVTPAGGHAMTFDSNGVLQTGKALNLAITDPTILNGASALNFDIGYDKSTQYAANYNNSSLRQDGFTSGELKGVRLDDNGLVYGTYTNGQELLQGQVALANFSNPNGLKPVSNNAWVASNEAGQAIMGSPSTGTMGTVTGGYLEGSNVDTTAEMVNLMSAQRNYQSNAKVLDVNSTMQQALLNSI
ncbi:flagellar hook protein FlgE [Shewanella frigidimarina]|uniref:Flagellar hook protein FlgE n=1 Tax=Shewanella frigidimarina TaxID=56812 RepID=A0A106BWA7_SHEFR|nr:flagellar hook protein FlgE [Shewanella frigidimarina]KVW99806.1 flagellar biosynthesis protein FlgE [Shewanella frigidimarina]